MHARTRMGESENLEYVFLYQIVPRWLINPPIYRIPMFQEGREYRHVRALDCPCELMEFLIYIINQVRVGV